MRRHIVALLVAVNLLLAGALAWMWVDERGELRQVQWVAPGMVKPELPVWPNSLKGPIGDAGSFLNTLDKPLFSPSRRPPPPPPPPVPPPPPDLLQGIQMFGVFGSGDKAGIFAKIEGRMRRLAKGEQVGDWVLKAVTDRDATFERPGESRVIRLTNANLTSGGARPVFSGPAVAPAGNAGAAPNVAPAANATNSPNATGQTPPPPRASFGGGTARPR